jgi:hypothetical protein
MDQKFGIDCRIGMDNKYEIDYRNGMNHKFDIIIAMKWING